ncbi:hypothetical protein [Nitrospirillum viridazoti]|uniref:Uncharacterized protein n=1 Tax=Nitrospirillum amazonense TaxID=28077 RepID=A0A560IZA9_9PROT|nr:hypothetical protein [Nitrospirillum amazonense]TWB62314.1 hypothetical protein FBZ92_105250 [Nitrospirillum amazonense]
MSRSIAAHSILFSAVVAGAVGLATVARSETLSADTALQAKFDAVDVNLYYHPTKAGYQVVVTAGTQDPASTVRFMSTLAPDQETVVSVPRGAGQQALELRLRRIGDQLELVRPVS